MRNQSWTPPLLVLREGYTLQINPLNNTQNYECELTEGEDKRLYCSLSELFVITFAG